MKIRINNIGPIKEADLEFSDKAVIVGGNATGKTFIAALVYFLLNPLIMVDRPLKYKLELPAKIEENREVSLEIPVNYKDIMEENKDLIGAAVKRTLTSIFGASIGELIRFRETEGVVENEKIKIILHKENVEVIPKVDQRENLNVQIFKTSNNFPGCVTSISPDGKIVVMGNRPEICLENSIGNFILTRFLVDPSYSPVAYISTERIASIFYLPSNLNRLILPPVSASLVKPLIADFLKYITPNTKFTLFGHEIEVNKELMIKVSKEGKEVNSSLVSTGIYQFIPVELALQHPLLKTVIIEEPEINLHVNAQIEVAKRLAREKAKKLLITTHSEWIPMYVAKLSKGSKIYEIVEGVLEERKVDEEGYVETFKTIFPVADKGIKELISREDENIETK
ncbi:AAA family ATPase [Sulfolobus acidocaldarius]|uniref:Endonuclease GajA/Old nuclease/RecF-like AAA domain-containing protein n=5 Tax=Sulfolobus acidocaldarius TaxID=2285 RepID=Q4J7P0_SULAC|nr:AAA family ATPase [Sulfolobus acidocaldarius]AAY81192.1 hypothetical protein Saci_1887 [Sulfolobus acidocaldarius DSM 639]AGE71811.1 hypothetical protein SacN8_09255 [Sulfolobus acidocaldarius N8]AGE74082.1 hypothetical protein SacRon12I_09275 [Sulfolobus acidocaldarius Ron12/I]ALU30685.1 hypothetical protein ATZ20_00070 [Sulfolobus acidocaldarius]WCM35694.1 AAA family ATPase [Sulfolobus acidocaldarius DSM 639]